MAHTPTTVSGHYFAARLLLRQAQNAPALVEVFRDRFKLEVSLTAVRAWLRRDQIPGPVVAHMLVADPTFDARELVSVLSPPVTAAEAALLL